MPVLIHQTVLPHPPEDVWTWHTRPGVFRRLVPPWNPVAIDEWADVALGARQRFRVHKGVDWRWEALIDAVEPPRFFRDVQVSGPFARWSHEHHFHAHAEGTLLEDRVDYAVPAGALGALVAGSAIHADLERTFAYRHRTTRRDLERHAWAAAHGPKHVAVSGASGLVGSALGPFLAGGGHVVHPMVRRPSSDPLAIQWDAQQALDPAALDGIDAVVHLAGAPIAQPWTRRVRERIHASRAGGTRVLCEALAAMPRKPQVLVCASAVGIYADRGDEVLTGESEVGHDTFLSDVCRAWEAATEPAVQAGIRVVNLRIGVVLDPNGGALQKMLPAARCGLFGPVGGGQQYLPWIALDDLVGLVHRAIFDDTLRGPMNATAPEPARQADFAHALGRALGRPSFLPTPSALVNLGGAQAKALLLHSHRAVPARALRAGYTFEYPDLDDALRTLLGR